MKAESYRRWLRKEIARTRQKNREARTNIGKSLWWGEMRALERAKRRFERVPL